MMNVAERSWSLIQGAKQYLRSKIFFENVDVKSEWSGTVKVDIFGINDLKEKYAFLRLM